MAMNKNLNIYFISLGCARNTVDTEVMITHILNNGWKITKEPHKADVIIINTCSFINSAKQESIQVILEMAEYKKINPKLLLIVTGCLPQRYKNELPKNLWEVDLFIGTEQISNITKFIKQMYNNNIKKGTVITQRTMYIHDENITKINTLSPASTYIKISEGCNHNCTFCVIPSIRGPLRSRLTEHIIKEIQTLADTGIIEFNLIAQDLSTYGLDIKNTDIKKLLLQICSIPKVQWVRLLYMYPQGIDDEFLNIFANEEKIVKYLDIPIQHASNNILSKMKRNITKEQIIEILEKIRNRIPSIALRTSLIVGFPQETEKDFEILCDFVKKQQFDHLGCFTYSREEGTAASKLDGQIPETIKIKRFKHIMKIQKQISKSKLKKFVGKTVPVLVERINQETKLLYEGRLPTQAPQVDGIVYINQGKVTLGSINNVKITQTYDYDLLGHIVE